jgi:predicted nucleic acid-binding protein
LNQKGITVPLTDLLIAALSITHKCEIFTTDRHFNHMPELMIYKAE